MRTHWIWAMGTPDLKPEYTTPSAGAGRCGQGKAGRGFLPARCRGPDAGPLFKEPPTRSSVRAAVLRTGRRALPEDAAHAPPLFHPRSAAAGRRSADALFPLRGRGRRRAGRGRSPRRPQTRFPGGLERSEKAGRYKSTGPPCKIFQIGACGKAAASFFLCAYCPFRAASIYRLIAATSLYFSTASPFWTTRVGAWLIP